MEQTLLSPVKDVTKDFKWSDYLSFKTMITLKIIPVVYLIGAVIITIASLVFMFNGDSRYMPGGFMYGLAILIFGNVGWRIWCELMIVVFRINKSASDIEANTRR